MVTAFRLWKRIGTMQLSWAGGQHETTRFHQNYCWFGSCVAASRTRAAGRTSTPYWRAYAFALERTGSSGSHGGAFCKECRTRVGRLDAIYASNIVGAWATPRVYLGMQESSSP